MIMAIVHVVLSCTEYTYNSDDNDMYSIVHVVLNILIIVMIMI